MTTGSERLFELLFQFIIESTLSFRHFAVDPTPRIQETVKIIVSYLCVIWLIIREVFTGHAKHVTQNMTHILQGPWGEHWFTGDRVPGYE